MSGTRQMTDDGQTTDNELAGGASVSPGIDQPPEITSSETHERTCEEQVEHEFEDDAGSSVSDLDVYYGDNHALNGVSVEIPENSVTAPIDPSDCGESALLRCLNWMNNRIKAMRIDGLVRLEGEGIYQGGIDLVELCKHIDMALQSPNLFPKSIADNISYGPQKHDSLDTGLFANLPGRGDDDAVDELVERSLRQAALQDEIQDHLDSNALGSSDGQQQRLCTAHALTTNPGALLMDEPAPTLDPVVTSEIESLAHDLVEEYTVVIVIHNVQRAMRVSDQAAVFLTDGRLIEYSDTDRVFENPQSRRVEDYINGKFW